MGLYDRDTVAGWVRCWTSMLRGMGSNPAQMLDAGRMAEFDKPKTLLKDDSYVFGFHTRDPGSNPA